MILLKRLFLKIHVHLVTYIYLWISWIENYFHLYILALTIVCIHELCHLLMAYYFHFEIEKIEILPFGAYLSLKDFYFHSIKEELCVVLAGPSSHLFMYICIDYFFHGQLKNQLQIFNSFIFFFNLLPIYPMDGHRFVCLILQSCMDLKGALYLSLKISVLSFAFLSLFYFNVNTFIIISFLLFQQFYFMKFIPNYLREYYSKIPSLGSHDKIVIHRKYTYRRGYHNMYFIDGSLYDEVNVIYALIKNIKK